MVYDEILEGLEKEHRLRRIPATQKGLDLISNDYMGLGSRFREFEKEFLTLSADSPYSASASRLLQRDQSAHFGLEHLLDTLFCKHTLLMNSGYHANVGALSSLSLPGTLIVSDKLIHASMIDGIRLGKGDAIRFAHNDLKMLRKILDNKAPQYKNVIVAVESIYSMDGDQAPLRELVNLKKEFPNVLLYVDEAHAFGVFGEKGLGVAEELGVLPEIDILIVTLGKAAAGYGAFIATTETLHSYFINCARSFIFSTALPPSLIIWNKMMIERILSMKEERRHLRELATWFRTEVEAITDRKCQSQSQIIPIHAGSAEKAIAMADVLRNHGIDALPIRRPTVATGTERLRISLSSELTIKDLLPVLEAIRQSLVTS